MRSSPGWLSAPICLALALSAGASPPPTPGGAPAWIDVAAEVARAEPILEDGEPVWVYELVVTEEVLRLADGRPYDVWAFGGSVPGPLLVVREGERIRITLVNETSVAHTVHSHGLHLPHRMDGVPHAAARDAAEEMLRLYARNTGSEVEAGDPGHENRHGGLLPPWAHAVTPGESFVYEFVARPAGTHFYHCHTNTNEHLDRGMSGVLVVLPREPEPAVDADVALVLDEWNSDYAQSGVPGDPRRIGAYDHFTLNGRSFPHTETLAIERGDLVRIRLVHAGSVPHFMHLHGHHFLVTHRDGRPLAEPLVLDTVEIGPGQRVDLLVLGDNPGAWPFHCHAAAHVTNAGVYPGGMLTRIQVGAEEMPPGLEAPSGRGLEAVRRVWRAWASRAAGAREEER